MTQQSKKAITELCEALDELAVGCIYQCGMETAARVLNASLKVKVAMNNEPDYYNTNHPGSPLTNQ